MNIFLCRPPCTRSYCIIYHIYWILNIFLCRPPCTTASPTLCVALCQTPTRSLERWEHIIIIIIIKIHD